MPNSIKTGSRCMKTSDFRKCGVVYGSLITVDNISQMAYLMVSISALHLDSFRIKDLRLPLNALPKNSNCDRACISILLQWKGSLGQALMGEASGRVRCMFWQVPRMYM